MKPAIAVGALRFLGLVPGLVAVVAGGGCKEEGRSLVPIDVAADGALSLARVSVVVSLVGSDRRWPVERDWTGGNLRLGVYLPSDVAGDVAVTACGLDSGGRGVAFGAGIPSTVAVRPGQVTTEVEVALVAGSGGDGCAVDGGSPDGGSPDAPDSGSDAAEAGTDAPEVATDAADVGSDAPDSGTDASDAGVDTAVGGHLAIDHGDYIEALDLTVEGTIDWAHWGAFSVGSFNHKATGGGKIGNVAPSPPYWLTEGGNTSWSDGTPNMVVTNTPNGVYMNYGGTPAAFTWRVEAATTSRTLRLYIHTDGVTNLTAHLSDGSAPDVSLVVEDDTRPIDVMFRAATTPATVSVKWEFTSTYGTVAVYAATLF